MPATGPADWDGGPHGNDRVTIGRTNVAKLVKLDMSWLQNAVDNGEPCRPTARLQ